MADVKDRNAEAAENAEKCQRILSFSSLRSPRPLRFYLYLWDSDLFAWLCRTIEKRRVK